MEQLPALPQPSGPVRILQITDLHHFGLAEKHTVFTGPRVTVPIGQYTDGDELLPEISPGNYSIGRGIAVIDKLLTIVQPALVVFSGDIIDGRMCEDFSRAMSEVVAPCVQRGIPWAFTPGNHDDDSPSGWAREDLLQIFQLQGCATPSARSFNHTYLLGKALRLWFFDSHGSAKTSKDGVTKETVAAYEVLSSQPEMVAEQRSGVVGLAYFHIPLREYGESDSIVVAGHLDTLADMRPQGYTGRMIGCPRSNTGLYNAMRRQRNVWAVSVVSGSVNVFVSW